MNLGCCVLLLFVCYLVGSLFCWFWLICIYGCRLGLYLCLQLVWLLPICVIWFMFVAFVVCFSGCFVCVLRWASLFGVLRLLLFGLFGFARLFCY